jgi:hypothetical protein
MDYIQNNNDDFDEEEEDQDISAGKSSWLWI